MAGWIAYKGLDCPVDPNVTVLVQLRGESREEAEKDNFTDLASAWMWGWDALFPDNDIIAYKVVG